MLASPKDTGGSDMAEEYRGRYDGDEQSVESVGWFWEQGKDGESGTSYFNLNSTLK